jgi:hypothetical protein
MGFPVERLTRPRNIALDAEPLFSREGDEHADHRYWNSLPPRRRMVAEEGLYCRGIFFECAGPSWRSRIDVQRQPGESTRTGSNIDFITALMVTFRLYQPEPAPVSGDGTSSGPLYRGGARGSSVGG